MALTAHARAEDRQSALTAGFQRYLAKPVMPEDLGESAQQAIDLEGATARAVCAMKRLQPDGKKKL